MLGLVDSVSNFLQRVAGSCSNAMAGEKLEHGDAGPRPAAAASELAADASTAAAALPIVR